jgi:hypothetical protein
MITQELEGSRKRGRTRKRWKEEVEILVVRRWERVGGI